MIRYGIWDQTSSISDRFLRRYIRDSFIEIALDFGDVAIDHDLDHLLEIDADHLVVFGSGHTSRSVQLKTAIENFCQQDFLLAGHLIQHGYPHLHPQMFILNLKRYRAIGCPMIGYPEDGETLSLHRPLRSPGNVHDDYTPLWLKPSGAVMACDRRGLGWHLISASLDHGMPVLNLPNSIRWAKRYLYPQDCPHRFAACLKELAEDRLMAIPMRMNPNQRAFLTDLLTPGATCASYLFNTEPIEPIAGTARRIFGLAAGFKLFLLWHQLGQGDVVYFDHNPRSLQLWQHIVTDWSGRDFAAFCQSHGHQHDGEQMQRVIDAVGGEDALELAWRRFQGTRPSFLLCDLLRDPEKLVERMAPAGNVVWYSNCFRFFEGIRRYGIVGCEAREYRFQELLLARAADTRWVNSGC